MTFSPNPAVRAAHNLPHISGSGSLVHYEFSIYSEGYLLSLLPFPLIILTLGCISLGSYLMLLMCRCCFSCCKCGPNEINTKIMTQESYSKWATRVARDRKAAIIFFSIFLSLTVFAIHALYFGNESIDNGVTKGGDAISNLADIFSSISSTADDLSYSTYELGTSLDSISCMYGSMSEINPILDTVETSSDSISSFVGSIPGTLNDGKSYLDDYGKTYKAYVLFCFYAVIMFVVIIYAIGAACKSRAMLYLGTIITFALVLGLTIICVTEMILVMFLGDMCMNPSYNIASMFGSGSAESIVLYYSSCIGTNPLGFDIGNATTGVYEINATLYDLYSSPTSPCYHETGVLDAINSMGTMFTDVDDILSYTDCGPLSGVWNTAMNEGVCDFFMSGFFIVWLSMQISALCLYLTMVSGSSMSHYYGKYWNISGAEDVREFDSVTNILTGEPLEEEDIELQAFAVVGSISASDPVKEDCHETVQSPFAKYVEQDESPTLKEVHTKEDCQETVQNPFAEVEQDENSTSKEVHTKEDCKETVQNPFAEVEQNECSTSKEVHTKEDCQETIQNPFAGEVEQNECSTSKEVYTKEDCQEAVQNPFAGEVEQNENSTSKEVSDSHQESVDDRL